MKEASPKLRLTALLFALFFGVFGVHRFYVQKIGTGLVQLFLTLTFVGLWISCIWTIIDWIMIAAGTFEDKQGRPLTVWTR